MARAIQLPSFHGRQKHCPGWSLRGREELPLCNGTVSCPDPLLNVRLLRQPAPLCVPETPCCLIEFGRRDRAGGDYRRDLSDYLPALSAFQERGLAFVVTIIHGFVIRPIDLGRRSHHCLGAQGQMWHLTDKQKLK